jgi:hypothetical protein
VQTSGRQKRFLNAQARETLKGRQEGGREDGEEERVEFCVVGQRLSLIWFSPPAARPSGGAPLAPVIRCPDAVPLATMQQRKRHSLDLFVLLLLTHIICDSSLRAVQIRMTSLLVERNAAAQCYLGRA